MNRKQARLLTPDEIKKAREKLHEMQKLVEQQEQELSAARDTAIANAVRSVLSGGEAVHITNLDSWLGQVLKSNGERALFGLASRPQQSNSGNSNA